MPKNAVNFRTFKVKVQSNNFICGWLKDVNILKQRGGGNTEIKVCLEENSRKEFIKKDGKFGNIKIDGWIKCSSIQNVPKIYEV